MLVWLAGASPHECPLANHCLCASGHESEQGDRPQLLWLVLGASLCDLVDLANATYLVVA